MQDKDLRNLKYNTDCYAKNVFKGAQIYESSCHM